ncbi:unknown [Firmicutes bacterium CAG:103]|nr:unknown [Firmicutes bacterium CAG:103]
MHKARRPAELVLVRGGRKRHGRHGGMERGRRHAGQLFRLCGDGQRRGVSQAGRALAALRHEAGQLPAHRLGGARHGEKLRPLARDGGGDALLPLPRRAGAHLRRTAGAHRRRARAHAHGRRGGHGRHALVSLGARSAKRLAPVRIRHAQRPVEPRGRISRIRIRPARRRALRPGSERRLALRHGQHGAAGEHAGDGRFRQRQPGLQAPAARAAAAGGGRGRKCHGGGAV